ncbi:SRPBCC family protein [Bdellovibrio sp. HCB337]|uniref:SRPBCC family protein n=1 Tax=Bdellovibrio sp. HCB337 TaxID=3394358 RepID=UPI0039A5D9E1
MLKNISIALGAIIVILVGVFMYTSRTSSTVVVEHTLNAPVEKVWAMWNDPETIKKWWSPKGYTAPVIKNDLQVGGTFLLSMQAPDGKMHWNSGKYVEIVPNQKIVSRMAFSDENGNPIPGSQVPVPGKWPDEITVTVEFTALNGQTKVKVTEEGIPTVMSLFAKMGWQQQFDKFDELLK